MRETPYPILRQAGGLQEAAVDPQEKALNRDEFLQQSGHKLPAT